MSISRLITIARDERLRSEQLQRARQSRSNLRFLSYLYWRNRYPVLTKILSRLMIVIEVALLFHYFHNDLATSISFVLYLFFLLGMALQGIIQAGRIWQITHPRLGDQQLGRYIGAVTVLIVSSCWFTLTAIVLGLLGHGNSRDLWILLFGFIVVPLELLEGQLWSLVYTEHRLARRFRTVAILRALPALMIILFHNSLGPLSYGIGILLARLGESLYLITLASRVLTIRDSMPLIDSQTFTIVRQLVADRSFRYHCLAPLGPQIYQLTLGVLLLIYRPYLWMIHFWFYQTLLLLLYVSLRPTYSLAMDIYLATQRCALRSAARLLGLSVWYSWIATLILSVAIVALACGFPAYTVLVIPQIWQLLPWLVISLWARTFFQTRYLLHKNIGTEVRHLHAMATLTILFGPPAQYFIISVVLGNLPLIYLVDSLIYLSAGIILGRVRLASSPVYDSGRAEQTQNCVVSPIDEVARELEAPNRFQSLSIFVIARQLTNQQLHSLLLGVSTDCRSPFLLTCIIPGIYCLFEGHPDSSKSGSVREQVLQGFSGHINATFFQSLDRPFDRDLFQIFLARITKTRDLRRGVRGLLERIQRAQRSETLSKILKSLLHADNTNPAHLQTVITVSIRKLLGYSPPQIAFPKRGEIITGRPADCHALFLASEQLEIGLQTTILPTSVVGDYPAFMVFNRPLAIVELLGVPREKREIVRDFAAIFSLLSAARKLWSNYPGLNQYLNQPTAQPESSVC